MFDNKRYVARGVNNTIPLSIQVLIWQMIDNLKAKKKKIDYLQVFELEFNMKYLKIHHRSECPKYSNTFQFCVGSVVTNRNKKALTIWIMDDGQYSLMMFPEER